jgi:hypothetical protein
MYAERGELLNKQFFAQTRIEHSGRNHIAACATETIEIGYFHGQYLSINREELTEDF